MYLNGRVRVEEYGREKERILNKRRSSRRRGFCFTLFISSKNKGINFDLTLFFESSLIITMDYDVNNSFNRNKGPITKFSRYNFFSKLLYFVSLSNLINEKTV